jgi:hypothetical protein
VACADPVEDDETYLLAQEYENAPGLGQQDFEPAALAKGAQRRFHPAHYRERIGNKVFELLDAD